MGRAAAATALLLTAALAGGPPARAEPDAGRAGPTAPFALLDTRLAVRADADDTSGARPSAGRTGFTVAEVTDPIPLHSSLNLEPTYQKNNGTGGKGYVNVKGVLVLEAGLPLFTRVEWPAPEVNDESGSTRAGVGDLTWLTLLLAGGTREWGRIGLGPVFVFPTASYTEMGQGKYQVGPALGYVNHAVPGWQFALLVQQYFSFAGDAGRARVNQLSIQPSVTKHLPGDWYVTSEPIITVDFEKSTNSVPLNLVVGKVLAGRWNVNLKGNAYPNWTSRPTRDYEVVLTVGYHFPALFSNR